MSADEIFVLILIAVFVGGIAAMEIRSRRSKAAADGLETAPLPSALEPSSTDAVLSETDARQKRRRR